MQEEGFDLYWWNPLLIDDPIDSGGLTRQMYQVNKIPSFPLTGERFYTDPMCYWYKKNVFQLYEQAEDKTYNCTEGGNAL